MTPHHDTFNAAEFSRRLLERLDAQQLSQSQLAARLGISRSTVTGWIKHGKLPDASLIHYVCRELDCSADWLLRLQEQQEQAAGVEILQDSSGSIQWREQLPLDERSRSQLSVGVEVFRSLLTEKLSGKDYPQHWQQNRASILTALRSGAIQLVDVARDHDQEIQLKQAYPSLKEIIVANVPRDYDTILRTEFVCFLAARDVLGHMIRPAAVGLGSGYTMLRLCELSSPTHDQFKGTAWVPLLAFPSHNTTDYTANYLARVMSIRHAGSHAMALLHPDDSTTVEAQFATRQTVQMMQNTNTIFVSVSGVDRRDRAGGGHVLAEFRSADYAAEAPDLRASYAGLRNKSEFGAELLRYLLDNDGKILSRDSAVGNQADLEILRYHSAMMGTVCIVAAGEYKAKAVLTCLRNKLANTLVIDSEIAAYLIDRG